MEINLSKIRESNIARINDDSLIELPLLDLNKINFRENNEIAYRSIALFEFRALSIYPESRIEALEWIKENNIYDFLSLKEQNAIENSKFSKQEDVEFSWYQESLAAFLWVQRIIKKLPEPTKEFDVDKHVYNLPPHVEIEDYLDNISLIPKEDIIKELDYYYLVHWLTRRNSKKYNLSVVIERRKALEWIVDESLDWDDISLDT